MKQRTIIIPVSALAAIVLIALAVYFVPRFLNTRFTFRFEDAVSKSWVWDATVTLDGREIRSFYQSSAGPVDYTFTHLRPGKATLEIKAPNYVTVKMPVRIRIGNNVLAKPIKMVGYRIPGLERFVMFETQGKSGLSVQMRPVNAAGRAITVMPSLDLWVGVLVSTEMKGGHPARGPVESGGVRGVLLYRGKIDWSWDPSPSQSFPYTAAIPYAKLSDRSAPELVVDYLVVVPDPRKISEAQVASMMRRAPDFTTPKELKGYLEREKGLGRFEYFFSTSWNVPGPAAPASS